MPDRQSLRWRMTNHRPSADEISMIEGVREQFIQTGLMIEEACPQSRELSLAITKLEESLMWAVASIARATNNTD